MNICIELDDTAASLFYDRTLTDVVAPLVSATPVTRTPKGGKSRRRSANVLVAPEKIHLNESVSAKVLSTRPTRAKPIDFSG
jgi:hypothetical protein